MPNIYGTNRELKTSLSKTELPEVLEIDYHVKIQWFSSGSSQILTKKKKSNI